MAYQKLDTGQVPLPVVTSQEVDYPTRSGDDDMGSIAQLDSLGNDIHATNNNGGAQVERTAQDGKLFGDLEREFAGSILILGVYDEGVSKRTVLA